MIPGIFINALIFAEGHSATVVPAETAVRSGEKQYVFIVNQDLCSKPNQPGKGPHSIKDAAGNTIPLAYKMVEVKTGAADKNMVEINPAQEIFATDQLVVEGGCFLMSALKMAKPLGAAPRKRKRKKSKSVIKRVGDALRDSFCGC